MQDFYNDPRHSFAMNYILVGTHIVPNKKEYIHAVPLSCKLFYLFWTKNRQREII